TRPPPPSSHPLSPTPLPLFLSLGLGDGSENRRRRRATAHLRVAALVGGAPAVAQGGTGGRHAGGALAPHGLTLDHGSTNHRMVPALSRSSAYSIPQPSIARLPFCGFA
ncbi:unnamed protein product, partial [Urochloa humidicola]